MVAIVKPVPLNKRKPENLMEWNLTLDKSYRSCQVAYKHYMALLQKNGPDKLIQICCRRFYNRERRFWRIHARFLHEHNKEYWIQHGWNN